ncbi:uncharacterized protein LOC131949446 [Physella acuta]|uniref:uncharacterized protein LOC131949446 n=1 Tax=Physella acuta TaxID=109671 RepID=UPI0027DE2B5A|nr:uncharacterized protein LOC131949446 [Physella acuta]
MYILTHLSLSDANGTKSSKGIVLCDYNEYVNNGESCRPCPPDTFIDSREHTLTRCHPCDAIKINQLPSRCVDEHFLFYLIVLTIIGLLLTLILTVFVVRAIFNRSKPKRKTTTSELKDESDIEISSVLKRNVSSEDVDASISDVGAGKVENRQPSDNHLLSSIRQYFIVENKKLIESEPLVRLESFDKEPVEMLEKQYIGSRVEETSINDDEESAIELVEESYPALGDGPSGVEPHNTESPIAEEEITPTAASSRGSLGDTENVKRSESSNLVLSTTPSEKSISSKPSMILSPKQSGTLTSTPSATLTPKPSVTLLPRPSVETTPKLNIGSSVDSFDSSVDDETKPKEKKPLTSSLVKRDGRGLPLSSKGKKVRLSIPIEQEEDEN